MYHNSEAPVDHIGWVPSQTELFITKEDLLLVFSSEDLRLYVKMTDDLLSLSYSTQTLISLPVNDKSFDQALSLLFEQINEILFLDNHKIVTLLKYIKIFDKDIYGDFISDFGDLVSKIEKPQGLPFIPLNLQFTYRKFDRILTVLKRL